MCPGTEPALRVIPEHWPMPPSCRLTPLLGQPSCREEASASPGADLARSARPKGVVRGVFNESISPPHSDRIGGERVLRGEGTHGKPAGRRAGYLMVPLCVALGMAGFFAAGAIARPSATTGCIATGRTIALCTTKLGGVLVNSKGHTLYLFNKDRHGKSTCYRTCAGFWPPLLEHGKPKLGPGVKRALLGTTRRSNGTRQLTYNKHPLYTYKLDTGAGQTNGEGLTAFGAKWYAVSPKGTAVKPGSGGTTTTSTNACTSPPCY